MVITQPKTPKGSDLTRGEVLPSSLYTANCTKMHGKPLFAAFFVGVAPLYFR